MAIRDGGDEFIVLGTPTGTGLPDRMAAFREAWASEFATTYGHGVVAPRILTMTTTGGRIVEARNDLGIRIAGLKDEVRRSGRSASSATSARPYLAPEGMEPCCHRPASRQAERTGTRSGIASIRGVDDGPPCRGGNAPARLTGGAVSLLV